MLDETQNERLRCLFATGSELAPGERVAFVRRECADDPALCSELAELLEIESGQLGDFLARPVVARPATVPPMAERRAGAPRRPAPPPQIEHYERCECIAEGGMGVVYKAHQTAPVRRTVAIKLLRAGADSESLLQRFEIERQALALMNHPYIATVHDAGTDALGRLFLVMEFVDGLPITEFCRRERLTVEARLALFIKVCEAIDHAHRRGVLHRDLKPSNVLVGKQGEAAVPKVIDFGVAKAIAGELQDAATHTLDGTLIGTPEYMSPEQIAGHAAAIDIRSDVYSLGVLLYEILAGVRPVESKDSRSRDRAQVGRLGSTPMPKPSCRVREVTARNECVLPIEDPGRWAGRLEGELDWIVMKALEHEPDRRYGTARELAADLGNHLAHRPVSAGPPSGFYLVRKFVRRHRVQVTAAALVLLSLLAGLFGTTWYLLESETNRATADRRAREAEAARSEADGVRLATEAAMLTEENPNLALLLALEASKATDSYAVHQTVHRVLPVHSLVSVLDGHDHGVRQVIYLADGRLLSRAYDATVLLWDPDAGQVVRRFAGHADVIVRMAVDAGEKVLLTICVDGTARVWDIASGDVLVEVATGDGPLETGALSRDGARFLTASRNGTVRCFDARSGAEQFVLRGHTAAVVSVAFDPARTRIATRAKDWTTRLWNAATGDLERVLTDPGAGDPLGELGVEFSPDGERVASSGRQLLVDSITGERVLELPGAYPLRFLDDDRLLFAHAAGSGIAQLDLGRISEQRWPEGEDLVVLDCTADGRLAVAVGARRDPCILDLSSNRIVNRLHGESEKRAAFVDVAFHPDGQRVALTGTEIRIWRLRPEFAPFDIPRQELSIGSFALAVGAEARVLIRRKDTQCWELWSIERQELLASFDASGMRELQLSPRGDLLVGIERVDTGAGVRAVVFAADGRRLRDLPVPQNLGYFSIRPDGRILATTHSDEALGATKSVTFHALETGEHLDTIRCPIAGPPTWTSAPTFDRLASRVNPYRTDVYDRRTGASVARAEGPYRASHLHRAISPDGRYLLVTDGGLRAVVWDLAPTLQGADAQPIAEYDDLVFGQHVWCGFAAGGRLCWVQTANEVHVFETLTARPFSVLRLDAHCEATATNAEGTEIVTVNAMGRCQRWPLDTVAVARRLATGQISARELDRYRVGNLAERLVRERAYLLQRPTPRNMARLGELALGDGDLDEAIRCYEGAFELRPLHLDYPIYLRLAELLCRRLAATAEGAPRHASDHSAATAALERARHYGAPVDEIEQVPGVDGLRALPRVAELLRR